MATSSAESNPPSFHPPLPTEILETIFVLCARDHYYGGSLSQSLTPPSWVNVSYVCRRWRNVALHSAALWTHLLNTSPRWAEELLIRSKQASLELNLKLHPWNEKCMGLRFFKQVVNHLERIRVLYLSLYIPNYEVALSMLSSRTPRLERLAISIDAISIDSLPTDMSSPLLLFDGDTPALRTLELTHCPVSWYSFKLTGLTALILHHIPRQSQQSTPDFLALLRCMQYLTHLDLYDSLPSALEFLSSAAFFSFQKISLSHLSRLRIGAPLSAVNALLSCITTPLETQVELGPDCCTELEFRVDGYTQLLSLLAQRYSMLKDQAVSGLTFRSLYIECDRDRLKLHFSISGRGLLFSISYEKRWFPDIALRVSLPFGQSMTSERDRLVTHTWCSISMSSIQRLHVTHPPASPAFWTDLLGYCPSLRRIKLSYGDLPELVSVLSLDPRDGTENQGEVADRSQRRILAPVLEELELVHISLYERKGMNANASIRSLCDALSARKQPRSRLIMDLCHEHTDKKFLHTFGMELRSEDGFHDMVSYKLYAVNY